MAVQTEISILQSFTSDKQARSLKMGGLTLEEESARRSALTPRPADFQRTATVHPPTEIRSGNRSRSPFHELLAENICGCFQSRWFHLPETQPKVRRPQCLRFGAAWNADASPRCAHGG